MSGGREKRAAGHPVQNNSHGYEWFFVPRIGCIFVDGDSSLNTARSRTTAYTIAVHKALGRRLAWLVLTRPCRREMGYVGPVSKLRKLKSCYFQD